MLHHPFPEEQEVVHSERITTVGQARRRGREIADGLCRLRLVKRSQFSFQNGPELLCTMVAIWQREAVHVPMERRLTSEPEVQPILHETGAAASIDSAGVHETEGARFYPEDVAFIMDLGYNWKAKTDSAYSYCVS